VGDKNRRGNVSMQTTIVDTADLKFSANPDEIIEAPSLGSCIGLSIFDPQIKAGGVLISILPDSTEIRTVSADDHPCMFADSAVVLFFQTAIEQGIRPERSKIVLIGGGQMFGQEGDFNLGTRNVQAAVDAIAKLGLKPTHQSTGGVINRSMKLHIKTGKISISVAGEEIEQL
jgi:chemotaxis protein CheD